MFEAFVLASDTSALEDALRYGGFVLAHAAWIASDLGAGELICPIAVIQKGVVREVIPFEAESQVQAINRGKASFDEFKDDVDAWAFEREGIFSIAGGDAARKDVLTVSSWVKQLDEPITLQQLFRPKAKNGFCLVGDLMISIHRAIPPDDVHGRLRTIVMEGVSLHPQGGNWNYWSELST